MLSILLLLGAICPALGAAVPTMFRRDVPATLLEAFNRFSQFEAASNCHANHNQASAGAPVYCDPGFCPLVRAADTQIIKPFWGLKGDTTGYLALDRTNKLIILAYRGTVSDENGLTDLQFQHVDASSVCAGCKAHTGFWQASSESMTTLLPQIKSAAKDNKDYKIVFVGHSLGGALATLSAVTMRKLGHTVDLYTFGAPSVGNLELADYITAQGMGANYRITHLNDEVPKVLYKAHRSPILSLLVPEYSQSSPEYWITSGNNVSVAMSDIQVIQGVNSEAGNLGTSGPITLEAHGWYMGNMSVCAQI
ncbi:Alpha/Beta hydrolase protein [Aspergillus leporis]|uniref:feruloyl esterase n=1 Tax=Aspergillus leporis TaxID=41062 RepID=A0A5N5WNM4_9EURO|nr:Alpha/Beta hydrolase protein [Aspergillus leporis]